MLKRASSDTCRIGINQPSGVQPCIRVLHQVFDAGAGKATHQHCGTCTSELVRFESYKYQVDRLLLANKWAASYIHY